MTKVCHITCVHSKEDVRIFWKECCSLAQAGYDVSLVQQGESYEKNGVHIMGFGAIASNRVRRMLQTARQAYKKAIELDADIYHLHDPELLPYATRLKRKGKKVIFDSHEHTAESILEKEYLPSSIRRLIYKAFVAYQSYVCRRLDGIISVTPNIVEFFRRINPRTVQIANYPIYQEDIQYPNFQERKIVFAGGISKQWNHHTIIQALEKLPDSHYCLCGIADSGYMQQLEALPGWKQVDYLGKIPHQEVAGKMAGCSVGMALLSPGRNTDWQNGTIGNTKIFEEMMAALPVICTDFVLWKDFVERYACGFCINPEDVDAIAEKVQYLLDHPQEAKRMGENGRNAVRESFNWGKEESKLFAFYEDILKN